MTMFYYIRMQQSAQVLMLNIGLQIPIFHFKKNDFVVLFTLLEVDGTY